MICSLSLFLVDTIVNRFTRIAALPSPFYQELPSLKTLYCKKRMENCKNLAFSFHTGCWRNYMVKPSEDEKSACLVRDPIHYVESIRVWKCIIHFTKKEQQRQNIKLNYSDEPVVQQFLGKVNSLRSTV